MTRAEGLTVVVANRAGRVEETACAVQALQRELDPELDQLVWVDRGGRRCPPGDPPIDSVVGPADADRGTCYGLGLAAVDRPWVAFTDSTTVVAPGWRAAAVYALEAGAMVVGGPVVPSRPRPRLGWAGFLVDYGPHAVEPYTSATGDVAGNNVAYHRCVLPPGGQPVWKNQVDARLLACGITPMVAPAMVATVVRQYGWDDQIRGRWAAGALYADQRSAVWSPPRRWLAAAGCAGLPAVALSRLWRQVSADRTLRRALLSCLPEVVAGLGAWSAGEAAAYARPHGSRMSVW